METETYDQGPKDLRIYTNTGIFEGSTKESEFIVPSPLVTSPVGRFETIAGKIVKFLLTTIGSDVSDPTYGSYITTYSNISLRYLPRMRMEIIEDLGRCAEYVRRTERAHPVEYERFRAVKLKDLIFQTDIRNRLDIFLEVSTTHNNYSILTLPVDYSK